MLDQVTEITRKHGVATIRTQSGETLRLPAAVYLERPLRPGQPLDVEAYRAFAQSVCDQCALAAAMRYLALRERSQQEARAYLRRGCYGEETVERVLGALEHHGLVSDRRFAEAWTAGRARKYGRNRLARELRQKGVAENDAQQALSGISQEEEYRRCLCQAEKLKRKFRGDEQKTAQALIRRGYPWPLARRAAREAGESGAPEEET